VDVQLAGNLHKFLAEAQIFGELEENYALDVRMLGENSEYLLVQFRLTSNPSENILAETGISFDFAKEQARDFGSLQRYY